MTDSQPNNPLHGITLKQMVTYLFAHYGWDGLYEQIPANCFQNNPSLKSSLNFLRKTPWARERVETVFVYITRNGINKDWLNLEIRNISK